VVKKIIVVRLSLDTAVMGLSSRPGRALLKATLDLDRRLGYTAAQVSGVHRMVDEKGTRCESGTGPPL